MRHPLLLPLIALILGLVGAWFLPAPVTPALLVPLLLIFGGALFSFLLRVRVFFVLVLIDVAFAGWLLGSVTNRAAAHPSLLDVTDFVRGPVSGVRGLSSSGPATLEGVLRQDASTGSNSVSLSLDVRRIRPDGSQQWQQVTGGVVASVSGAMATAHLDDWRAGRLVRAPAALREPTIFENPGLRDERLALARRDINLFASTKSAALVEVVRRGSWWEERAADVRAFARRAIDQAVGRWSQQSAGIVIAILIGDRAGLSSDVVRRLQEAGTYHVIAISGGNIAILAGFLLGLCRLLEIRTRVAACGTIAVLIAYADLVGGGASVVRATLMGVAWLAALAFDLRGSALNALFAAACVILAATPLALYDIAFALTFGATFGILVASRTFAAVTPSHAWLRAVWGLLVASLSAELALLPVGAYAFYRVTFAGLVLNFFAIPLMAVAQLAGTFVLPLALVDSRLAAVAGFVAHVGAAGLVSTASLVDWVPVLTWRVPAPPAAIIGLYYAAFAVWFISTRSLLRRWWHLSQVLRCAAVAMITVSTVWILWSPLARLRGARATGLLRLTVIDVGQADAMLVRFPNAATMLVDAGGSRAGGTFDIGGRVIAPVLWNHDVFRLDRFVLSHGDPDHLGGAVALLRAFPVGEFWEGIDVPRDAALQQLHAEVAARRIPSRQVRAGERMRVGGADVTIWHPPPPDWERQKIRNDDSIVMEIRLRDVSLLLTGDIGMEVERPLARRLHVAPLCVMKVPHHGSGASSAPAFLSAVHPAVAFFTVGDGAIGTPAFDDVIARYASLGAQIFTTGADGALEIETDGRTVTVTTFARRRLTVRPKA